MWCALSLGCFSTMNGEGGSSGEILVMVFGRFGNENAIWIAGEAI